MKVFQELVARGPSWQIAATVEAVCSRVSGDWSRDVEAEAELDKWNAGGKTFCFDRASGEGLPGATLFLAQKDDALAVTNIVPAVSGQLNHDEYNAILQEFFGRFVAPAAAQTGLRAELTKPDADLEHWLTPDAAKKLRAFCAVANKRTGASHPADKRFWYDFVVAAHREGADFPASTLERWLHEVGGWDEEWANRIAIQYEQARGLLAYAEHQAVGA
jgi:hypothetical protein